MYGRNKLLKISPISLKACGLGNVDTVEDRGADYLLDGKGDQLACQDPKLPMEKQLLLTMTQCRLMSVVVIWLIAVQSNHL